MTEEQLQRAYYARTAADYDGEHNASFDEHEFALAWLSALIEPLGVKSILDIGSGTGRALVTLRRAYPNLRVVGIEPSAELRAIGHHKGLDSDQLIEGNALSLPFQAGEFDLVTEFGVLHHIRTPEIAVAEMLRVGRLGVLISDSNNFGQGSGKARLLKQAINAVGGWRLFDLIRTRGKGFHWSEGDGIYYSYSVYQSYRQIAAVCPAIHVLNTKGGGINPYRTAPQVALLGLKMPVVHAS